MKNSRKKQKWVSYGTFAETKKEWMKNPKFRKAYNDLEFEFVVIRFIIELQKAGRITKKEMKIFETEELNSTLEFVQKLTKIVRKKGLKTNLPLR